MRGRPSALLRPTLSRQSDVMRRRASMFPIESKRPRRRCLVVEFHTRVGSGMVDGDEGVFV